MIESAQYLDILESDLDGPPVLGLQGIADLDLLHVHQDLLLLIRDQGHLQAGDRELEAREIP